jgi:hypothetical protein
VSREFAAALEKAGRLARSFLGRGQNHFEIIETLGDPASPLAQAAFRLLA